MRHVSLLITVKNHCSTPSVLFKFFTMAQNVNRWNKMHDNNSHVDVLLAPLA